jgi:hypothetical protein
MLELRPNRPVLCIALAVAMVPASRAWTQSAVEEPPAVPAAPATPAAPSDAAPAATPPADKVIEGRVNIYSWAPDESARKVDATDIDMRQLYADLGPVAKRWHQHLVTLSNPWFEGRAPGLRGNELAAEYLEFWLKDSGLAPAFPAIGPNGETPKDGEWTSHRQHFILTGGAPKVESAEMSVGGATLERDVDWSVLGISGNASVEAPVAFVGYAIESGDGGYSSFEEGTDLTGKVALMFRYEPLDERGRSRWATRRFSEHSAMSDKVQALVDRGAAAIVMVAPPGVRDGRTELEDVATSRWGRPLAIPMVQVSEAVAERILRAGQPEGGSLMDWRTKADEGKVRTVDLGAGSTVKIATALSTGGTPTQNVGGVVRGKGKLADEWVIVGAHFDHVGYGYFGTAPQYTGQLHAGADDNASGTSAMLCVAEAIADLYAGPDAPEDARSVLFLAFSAEESGLEGSKWYVEHPTIPGSAVSMMINMDMVGRLRSDDVSVGGMKSAKDLVEILRPAFERSGLTIRADPSGRGPSDHASFYGVGIPVAFIYTGNHPEYHTPADTFDTVNPVGAAKLVGLAADMVQLVATRPEKLEFQSTDGAATADRGYAAVRLGVMPAMTQQRGEGVPAEGVMVDGVSADTSAADAGLTKGDVILAWDGALLETTGDMMGKLREHKPGDEVTLKVWREGKEIEVKVTLKAAKR